jgi:hypothetical protein
MTGLEGTRFLNDEESDIPPVNMEDYDEWPSKDDGNNTSHQMLRLQKQYFIETCQLAQLGMWKSSIFIVVALETETTWFRSPIFAPFSKRATLSNNYRSKGIQ